MHFSPFLKTMSVGFIAWSPSLIQTRHLSYWRTCFNSMPSRSWQYIDYVFCRSQNEHSSSLKPTANLRSENLNFQIGRCMKSTQLIKKIEQTCYHPFTSVYEKHRKLFVVSALVFYWRYWPKPTSQYRIDQWSNLLLPQRKKERKDLTSHAFSTIKGPTPIIRLPDQDQIIRIYNYTQNYRLK